MSRKKFSTRERVRIFELNKGCCHLCRQKIQVGEAWELEHITPWELTRGFDREYVGQATETAPVSHVEPENEYTAPPSSPAAVDADAFPGDLQEGAEVSSPASAPSTNPLLVECCRKLMNIAIDEGIERPNRRGVLEAAKDNWKEILPASDHEILKRFFMSADQIIKGNAQYSRVIQIYAEMLEVSEKELGA